MAASGFDSAIAFAGFGMIFGADDGVGNLNQKGLDVRTGTRNAAAAKAFAGLTNWFMGVSYDYLSDTQKRIYDDTKAKLNKPGISNEEKLRIMLEACTQIHEAAEEEKEKNTYIDGISLYQLKMIEAEYLNGPFGGQNLFALVDSGRYSLHELEVFFRWFYSGKQSEGYIADTLNTLRDYYEQWKSLQASEEERAIFRLVGMILLSFTPLDEFADAAQVAASLSRGDLAGAAFDGVGFIPFVEMFKYIDELKDLLKHRGKIKVILGDGTELWLTHIDEVSEGAHDVTNGVADAAQGAVKVPSASTKVNIAPEIKAPNAIKASSVTQAWDDFLGPNTTNINPRTGIADPDRIFSTDGTRAIRLAPHEMDSIGTAKGHFHYETWEYDAVNDAFNITNTLQRIIP